MSLDEEAWARARGWAMWKALYEMSELKDKSGAAFVKQQEIVETVIAESCVNDRL